VCAGFLRQRNYTREVLGEERKKHAQSGMLFRLLFSGEKKRGGWSGAISKGCLEQVVLVWGLFLLNAPRRAYPGIPQTTF
jgi:hypothetical protein